jgi:Flp pilus assembly protein TadB
MMMETKPSNSNDRRAGWMLGAALLCFVLVLPTWVLLGPWFGPVAPLVGLGFLVLYMRSDRKANKEGDELYRDFMARGIDPQNWHGDGEPT